MTAVIFEGSPDQLTSNPTQLLGALNVTENPRLSRRRLHPLMNILVIALCAIGAGAYSWGQVASYVVLHTKRFASHLDLTHGIPSHDTFSRVFSLLQPSTVELAFTTWAATRPQAALCGRQTVFGGKVLR